MAEKLDFSLPEKKSRGRLGGAFMVLLLLVVAGLAVANLVVASRGDKEQATATSGGLSAAQVKGLAAKLAQRNLHEQAAAVWRDYLASAELTNAERAKVLFQIATSFEKAGQYANAIENYYRSESTAPLDELGSQINTHVKECFERLGKFSSLRYEMMDRTSLTSSEPAGGKVVAEIGNEKITEADLDAAAERVIEGQLSSMEAFMTTEQLNEQKKRALEQYSSGPARQEFLQNWLAQEILYRQALEDGLGDEPRTKRVLEDLARGVLSQELMNQKLASRVSITETDVQTYYAAHKDQYVESARAKISHLRVSDETRAHELLKRLKDGEDFAALAQEFSEDQGSKDNGGQIAEDVVPGPSVPGIGDANEINAAIFAAEGATVLDKAFQTDQGWEIVKVQEKKPPRQKSFDEVAQQVATELRQRKRQEVQSTYIKEVMDKHNVVIHTSAFAPAPPSDAQEPSPQQ